jgi:hypothetical protein
MIRRKVMDYALVFCLCLLGAMSVSAQNYQWTPLGYDNATYVVGKIYFIYANPGNNSTDVSFVCMKNATQGTHPGTSLGSSTQSTGYFAFNNTDRVLSATLMTAMANGLTVQLYPSTSQYYGYNYVSYVLVGQNP